MSVSEFLGIYGEKRKKRRISDKPFFLERLSEGDDQKLITALPSISSVSYMKSREIKLQSDRDHMESMRSLAKLRCLVHGDLVMIQRRDGGIVFWCGCERPGESFEAGNDFEREGCSGRALNRVGFRAERFR